MAQCHLFIDFQSDENGEMQYVISTNEIPIENCSSTTNAIVMLEPVEYETIVSESPQELEVLFEQYFGFDQELFLQLQGWFLLSLVIGFSLGKTINILNIANR